MVFLEEGEFGVFFNFSDFVIKNRRMFYIKNKFSCNAYLSLFITGHSDGRNKKQAEEKKFIDP